MENVRTYAEVTPLVISRRPAVQEQDLSKQNSGARYVIGLVMMVHFLSGGFVALAAAFTSEMFLLTTFWQGAILGGVMYGLIVIVIGADEYV